MASEGLVSRPSNHGMKETIDRYEAALAEGKLTVFARVDHAAGAAEAGITLRPTFLIVFGNPRGGTPLMQANQVAGIDLPLKALIWEDAGGKVWLTYNDPAWLAARHGLGAETGQPVAGMTAALAKLAAKATD